MTNSTSLSKEDVDLATIASNMYVGEFTYGPFPRGMGLTLANALRRVLLSSLQGAAVSSIKIDGVEHEFSCLNGVREDITDIILNIKCLELQLHGKKKEVEVSLSASGACVVTAGMIDGKGSVEVLNPDLVICHLSEEGSINIKMEIRGGTGYVPSEVHSKRHDIVGFIPVDAYYNPVKNVSYNVEKTRVGDNTEYETFKMHVSTNGSVTAEDAIKSAARILMEELQPLVGSDFVEEEEVKDDIKEEVVSKLNENLMRKVEDLELSVRASNCLKYGNIVYLGDLVQKTEQDMMQTPNFGRKSLNEIKDLLTGYGLYFGMELEEEWPPENIEELSKKLEDKY